MEVFLCLEHVARECDAFHVILARAGRQTHQHDDGHRENAGVEHLLNEGHVDGQELKRQRDRNREHHTCDSSLVGGFLPEKT